MMSNQQIIFLLLLTIIWLLLGIFTFMFVGLIILL